MSTYSVQVENLITQMSVEEKVGQMTQLTVDVISKGKDLLTSYEPWELDPELIRDAIVKYKVGSILNVPNNRARTLETWYKNITTLQEIALTETRLKIPLLYGIDAIHGTTYTAGATMFPQQIGMAATWNRDLVKKGAEICAYETRASSIPWNFSPVLDMGRNPYWPRIWETYGEAVYLTTAMGKEVIKGYEGNNNTIANPHKVASCIKHFLGSSIPVTGKDRTPVILSPRELREIHLPPFKAAIEAGAHSVMLNSGLINGIPVHGDFDIITTLLKEELGFKGMVVTDWADIDNMHNRDKVAPTIKDAIKMGINAGIDMSMVPYNYGQFHTLLVELINEGEVKMERIDDAVKRILHLKEALGLFENPTTHYVDYPDFASKKHQNQARKAAEESITLLKNDGILPLSKNLKIFLTGPNAHSLRTLNGGWTYSWQGEKVHEFSKGFLTIKDAIETKINPENLLYAPGLSYASKGKFYLEEDIAIDHAVNMAEGADVIICCIGENTYTEKPGDLHELNISKNQENLVLELQKLGKPIILVLNEGRPRIIREINDDAAGIVHLYLPGNHGGEALANILFGEVNPSGKLPYTYPKHANSPITYDHKPSENQERMAGAYDYESEVEVQYDFGHGLSYTDFKYANLRLNSKVLRPYETLKISVDVENIGFVEGKEVVMLFTSDLYASVTPDNKQLKGFEKIFLTPGQKKTVIFEIKPEDLAFIGRNGQWITEEGTFRASIGGLSEEFEFLNQ